jgi:hypothetical protein
MVVVDTAGRGLRKAHNINDIASQEAISDDSKSP